MALALAGCFGDGEAALAAAGSAPPTPAVAESPNPAFAATAGSTRPNSSPAERPQTGVPDRSSGARDEGKTLIQLIDPLDEPEFYCVDVPGFGANLNLSAALSAHTCKPGADDEMFLFGDPLPGNLQMPAYRLCLEAGDTVPGSSLLLNNCADSPLQRFLLDEEGSVQLDATNLCLAVAPGAGQPTGGPSHLRRDLALEDCATVPGDRKSWRLPGPAPA